MSLFRFIVFQAWKTLFAYIYIGIFIWLLSRLSVIGTFNFLFFILLPKIHTLIFSGVKGKNSILRFFLNLIYFSFF